jgi:thiamine pyrophosphokinase
MVEKADVVIATDGAASYCERLALDIDIIIGDMDSLSRQTYEYYHAFGAEIIEDPDQHSNDFEKALKYSLTNYDCRLISVLGIHGKRTDHLMTNFSVMLRFSHRFPEIEAFDATHRHFFLTTQKRRITVPDSEGMQISLTPMPVAMGVSITGLLYPIKNEEMIFGEREGLSNIITSDNAAIEIESGSLLVSIPFVA